MATDMMITFEVEFDKRKIENFDELINAVRETSLEIGRKIVVQTLDEWDNEICEQRDKKRYRCNEN